MLKGGSVKSWSEEWEIYAKIVDIITYLQPVLLKLGLRQKNQAGS